MTRRPTAPDAVLIARALGSVTLVLAYAALRVPQFGVSPIELAATWIGAVFALFVFERAASELYLRHHFRERFAVTRTEPTEVIPTARPWPSEIDNQIATARHEATHALVDRGQLTEHLFTHDVLCEPTPPSGTAVHEIVESWHQRDAVDAFRYATEYVGRHRAPSHLDRDRFGQLFGQF